MSPLEVLKNPTVRRLLVGAAAAATVALNKKFGLGLDATDVMTLGGLALGYILQSGAKDAILGAKQAGADAAAAATPEQIAKAIADAVAAAQPKAEVKP